ncbi:SH3-domain-containing protein [Trametes cingulata]|nr:SH3-domain-containing protein [Trametes cingulata]
MPLSTPTDPQAAALLAHVLSQTQQNISFLASQNYISPTEAAELITRLSQGPRATNDSSLDSLASGVNNLAVNPARSPSPARRVIPPPPPRHNVKRARALWAYNEDGREPNDLSFSAGEIVEIVDETNADWWTGKCRGKQGLFPSNYVELLDAARGPASPPPATSMPAMPMPMSSYHQPPPPQPYGMPSEPEKAAMYQQPYSSPPPAPIQSPPVQVVTVQQEQPPKKNKFGKLGSTMATSAAGGVGFGAGAAIGSGIINSIF